MSERVIGQYVLHVDVVTGESGVHSVGMPTVLEAMEANAVGGYCCTHVTAILEVPKSPVLVIKERSEGAPDTESGKGQGS